MLIVEEGPMKCERCGEYKKDVFRRADHGGTVCSDCDVAIVSAARPSKYVRRLPLPEWLRS